EGVLDGQDAVKAGEQKRRALGGVRFEQGDQLKGQTGGAEKVAGAAGFVEGLEPVAEGCRILLPGCAGRRAQEAGSVRAEQLVCFHGQCGQAVAWAFKQGGGVLASAGDGGPEGFFLGWIQQQAAVFFV